MKAFLYTLIIFFLLALNLKAQESTTPGIPNRKNYVTAYFGMFEYNLNYERNLFQFHRSYTNIRTGFGQMNNLQATGYVYNLTLVHLLGRQSSHFEFNIGVKYIKVPANDTQSTFYPDLFLGYRFEQLDGNLIWRAGLSGLSLINVGAGFKF
jgi:hypothetical protein